MRRRQQQPSHRYNSLRRSYSNSDRLKIQRAPEPTGPGKYCAEAVPARRNADGELVIPKFEQAESQPDSRLSLRESSVE
jgi:hypothetical protein